MQVEKTAEQGADGRDLFRVVIKGNPRNQRQHASDGEKNQTGQKRHMKSGNGQNMRYAGIAVIAGDLQRDAFGTAGYKGFRHSFRRFG